MTLRDLEDEGRVSMRHFFTVFFLVACLVVIFSVALSCNAHAQTPGVDLANNPLPYPVISKEIHATVVSASGYSTIEDIPPNSAYWHWLASGFAIRAEQAARVTLEQQLYSCNLALAAAMAAPEPEYSDQRLNKVLWKPTSDGGGAGYTGNLVVLTDEADLNVNVEGAISETLKDTGPGNGYGTTARSRHTGCSFGDDVKVTFYDSQGRIVRTDKGLEEFVIIPDGCERKELRF